MLEILKTVTPSPEQWEIIIEGARNPMESWDKSDSSIEWIANEQTGNMAAWQFHMGENDHDLLMRLARAGSDHGKYRRMVPVWATIRAPLFWWAQFDTYKVATVRNSCSKMHKIHVHPFRVEDFTHNGCWLVADAYGQLLENIDTLERLRQKFNETGDKRYWRAMIELLPDGYMMRATVMVNYETLANIYKGRRHHKIGEWNTVIEWIRRLPYSDLITLEG